LIEFLDLWRRAESGPEIRENEFDMKVLPKKAEELRREYNIRYNPQQPIPLDATLAKDTYEAALRLICEVGVICTDTGRIIKVTEEEVKEALQNAQREVPIGDEGEITQLISRHVGDGRKPLVAGGPCGCPLSERLYTDILHSYAKEREVDIVVMGPLTSYQGLNIRVRSPIELLVARAEASAAREAIRKADRAGMCIFGGISVVTAAASNFADFPDGLRPTDMHEVAQLNELKMSWEVFNRMVNCQQRGNLVVAAQCPVLGQVGGPEATAILCAAEALQGFALTRGVMYCMAPSHISFSTTTDREDLWVGSLVTQAIKSASRAPVGSYIYSAAGPSTEMQCREIAAHVVAHTDSGGDMICSAGGTRGAYVDHYTGMEARIAAEVSCGATALNLATANELVKELLASYEEQLRMKKAPQGRRFDECYNLEEISPSEEYMRLWENVRGELENLGMPNH
jgi:methylamine--corrinoid protein Co-methyltransferase